MPTVLVIDDATDIRLLVRAVLSRSGFEVAEAAGGREALAWLDHHPRPDVVVLDVQMPEMNGWETLAAIRGRPETATLPVVLCTVKARPEDAHQAWAAGCDGYVAKPFAISDLVEEVSTVAARRPEELESVRRVRLAAAESKESV